MSLPNSNAHRASAPENPNTTAPSSHRSGQGKALRTDMRDALWAKRLRSNRKRIQIPFN
jgi:hypothetical protein